MAEARSDAARETVTHAADRIQDERQVTPEALRDALDIEADQTPPVDALEEDVNRYKRQRDSLGAVNLRADEEARGVGERRDVEEARPHRER